MIGTILWALVVGIVLGYLGKLLLPGRQAIPAWATIGAGIVAALLGGWVGSLFGWTGFNLLKFGLQLIFAVIAIALVSGVFNRRRPVSRY
jgi:uncharacterized membrane protein YeaQ/YmgE (transglycosylase-associated protein family)